MTAACQTCRDLIGGYVLDALEPSEREVVRRHLEVCEPCAREHAELAAIPALLDAADSADAVPLRPPERLEEAVLDRFARERRGSAAGPRGAAAPSSGALPRSARRRRWLVPALAVTAAVAALALVVTSTGSDDETPPGPSAEAPRVYRVALSGAGPVPRASGHARLYPGATGTGVHLEVTGLRPTAYDYELWCVRDDGWRISAGTFRVGADGRADVNLTTAARPSDYDALAVEARPAGGGARADGPRVLEGRLGS